VDDEYVTMREAQEILGVSNFTMWQLVKRGELTAYQSATDRRKKLIRRADLDTLRTPQAITGPEGEAKKVAA
jgi:excisionase family DNA binding protein